MSTTETVPPALLATPRKVVLLVRLPDPPMSEDFLPRTMAQVTTKIGLSYKVYEGAEAVNAHMYQDLVNLLEHRVGRGETDTKVGCFYFLYTREEDGCVFTTDAVTSWARKTTPGALASTGNPHLLCLGKALPKSAESPRDMVSTGYLLLKILTEVAERIPTEIVTKINAVAFLGEDPDLWFAYESPPTDWDHVTQPSHHRGVDWGLRPQDRSG